MKHRLCLHSPTATHLIGTGWCSCGPTLLSILFHISHRTAVRIIQNRRERLNYRGILQQFKEDGPDIEEVEWCEILGILRQYQPSVRNIVPVFPITVENLASKSECTTNRVYVVRVHDHCMIIKHGMVLDGFTEMCPPSVSSFSNCSVLDYCVLTDEV